MDLDSPGFGEGYHTGLAWFLEETASLAVRAAMTGHLVLSTLHTNDAFSAIAGLRDLGVESNAIADVVRVIIAQRLIRKVCPSCLGTASPHESKVRARPCPKAVAGRCATCHGIGFAGRTGVFEVLFPDPCVRALIGDGTPIPKIREHLPGAYRALAEDARNKVAQGITTEAEARRTVPCFS